MNVRQALAFIRRHGVVLEAGRGPLPSLAGKIAGGSIRGSWWSHPRSGLIFRVTRGVRDSTQVLVCRAAAGKITFVHRRAWPALVRLASRFPKASLARIREVHTASGKHVLRREAFPKWVPASVSKAAAKLTEAHARRILGNWAP
ncbi:MAG TPA: hypothetical protein VIC61_05780 [Gammaproteobacteria bacterium]